MRRLIVWIVWFAISFSMEAQQPVKVYVKDGIAVDSMISTVCPRYLISKTIPPTSLILGDLV
jgi:hypothetical protein